MSNEAFVAGQVLTFLTALAGVVVSILNHRKVQEVHLLVNSQRDELIAEIKALKDAAIAQQFMTTAATLDASRAAIASAESHVGGQGGV